MPLQLFQRRPAGHRQADHFKRPLRRRTPGVNQNQQARDNCQISTHAQVKWHNRRNHNQGTNVPRSPGTRRAARRQSPDTVCAIDCYSPKLTYGCLTAFGSMDHVPEQELCVTAIPQITAIGLHRARHDGTLSGFLQCSHGCQQGTEHPEQYKEAVLIHVKTRFPAESRSVPTSCNRARSGLSLSKYLSL